MKWLRGAAWPRRDEAANAAGSWDADFVGAYGRAQRRRLEDEYAGAGGWGFGGFGAPSASGRDPKGYYAVLGVDPGCSTSELQARRPGPNIMCSTCKGCHVLLGAAPAADI